VLPKHPRGVKSSSSRAPNPLARSVRKADRESIGDVTISSPPSTASPGNRTVSIESHKPAPRKRGVLHRLARGTAAIGWATVLGLSSGCRQAAPPPPQADAGVKARSESLGGAIQTRRDQGFLGVVLPRRSVDVAAEIPGRIEWIHVREGDVVRRGQAVATLDRGETRQELAMALAGLHAAEAEVSRHQVELDQAENLLSRRLALPDFFPKEQIRQAELQKQGAQADLEAAQARRGEQQAQVAQVREKLGHAEVRSPVDGTVARRYLEVGALAGTGQPIVRLISAGDLIVRFAAPPERARSLASSQPVTVELEGAALPARIEQVSPEIDPPSGMVLLVAALDAGAAGMRPVKPGSVVRVYPATGPVDRSF
jgi:RND family efflux transporter MFP subunit